MRRPAAISKAPPKIVPSSPRAGHLDSLLGYALRRAQLAVFNDFRKVFSAFDLRPSQYAVLSIIGDHPGLKQSQVSAALGIKRANFVAMIDGLEKRGLASRAPIAGDKRSYALVLTEKGRAFMSEMRRLNDETEARLAGLVGPEGHAKLLDLLHALIDGLGAEAEIEPSVAGEG